MNNSIYKRLNEIKFLSKSYTFKFLFIAFLGIHIPLIGLIFFIIFKPASISGVSIFVLTLLLILGASALTLIVLNSLLAPSKASKSALVQYLTERKLPDSPTDFHHEAGILMQKVQETVVKSI